MLGSHNQVGDRIQVERGRTLGWIGIPVGYVKATAPSCISTRTPRLAAATAPASPSSGLRRREVQLRDPDVLLAQRVRGALLGPGPEDRLRQLRLLHLLRTPGPGPGLHGRRRPRDPGHPGSPVPAGQPPVLGRHRDRRPRPRRTAAARTPGGSTAPSTTATRWPRTSPTPCSPTPTTAASSARPLRSMSAAHKDADRPLRKPLTRRLRRRPGPTSGSNATSWKPTTRAPAPPAATPAPYGTPATIRRGHHPPRERRRVPFLRLLMGSGTDHAAQDHSLGKRRVIYTMAGFKTPGPPREPGPVDRQGPQRLRGDAGRAVPDAPRQPVRPDGHQPRHRRQGIPPDRGVRRRRQHGHRRSRPAAPT